MAYSTTIPTNQSLTTIEILNGSPFDSVTLLPSDGTHITRMKGKASSVLVVEPREPVFPEGGLWAWSTVIGAYVYLLQLSMVGMYSQLDRFFAQYCTFGSALGSSQFHSSSLKPNVSR
jgi:hypothetical protein